jgi:hypothetical protein
VRVTKRKTSFQPADFWTYIGTFGFFMSSFPYATESIAQLSDTTARSFGYDVEHAPSIFGVKKIGNVSTLSCLIGGSIALIATLGFCYAIFHQLLFYQNDCKEKFYKKNKRMRVFNWFAILGVFIIVNIWISGSALTIFLLLNHLSVETKMLIMCALWIIGIIPAINYTKKYARTLPKEKNETEANKNDKPFWQKTTNAIVLCTGFFCNTSFLASLVQSNIFYKTHLPQFCHITIFAWGIGSIIGLFFTTSAVYIYPILLGNYNKKHMHSKVNKKLQYIALVGYSGITMLDIFFPIAISLIYAFGKVQKNTPLTVLYIVAACLSLLCTIAPVKSAKTAIEKYNAKDADQPQILENCSA